MCLRKNGEVKLWPESEEVILGLKKSCVLFFLKWVTGIGSMLKNSPENRILCCQNIKSLSSSTDASGTGISVVREVLCHDLIPYFGNERLKEIAAEMYLSDGALRVWGGACW